VQSHKEWGWGRSSENTDKIFFGYDLAAICQNIPVIVYVSISPVWEISQSSISFNIYKNTQICTSFFWLMPGYERCGMGWKYTYARGIPIEAQYLHKKAMVLYTMGKTESALKYLRQTMVIAPRYSKALFDMGNCLTKLGLYDEATARFAQAVEIDPSLKNLIGKRDE
jgi:tetratricopeptide (TPR) repeat protein